MATVERLDTRQLIVLTRKAKKEDSKDKSENQLCLSHNEINRTDNEEVINKKKDTVQGPTSYNNEIESQKAWTMGMPTIDGDISTMDSEELEQIEDNNKKFLYARMVHANHMIQHHMHEISECHEWLTSTDPWPTEEGKWSH